MVHEGRAVRVGVGLADLQGADGVLQQVLGDRVQVPGGQHVEGVTGVRDGDGQKLGVAGRAVVAHELQALADLAHVLGRVHHPQEGSQLRLLGGVEVDQEAVGCGGERGGGVKLHRLLDGGHAVVVEQGCAVGGLQDRWDAEGEAVARDADVQKAVVGRQIGSQRRDAGVEAGAVGAARQVGVAGGAGSLAEEQLLADLDAGVSQHQVGGLHQLLRAGEQLEATSALHMPRGLPLPPELPATATSR